MTARYAVHDGVADPRRWQEVVRSFISDGQLVQGDDGRMSWIPPDRGLGPQAFEPSLLPQARAVADDGGRRRPSGSIATGVASAVASAAAAAGASAVSAAATRSA